MEETVKAGLEQAKYWTEQYGHAAAVPALLLDPAGVPWAWIFLMLLAGETGRNIPLMFVYGFVALTLCDHALYWAGVKGGRPLLERIGRRFPGIAGAAAGAEAAVREKGLWAVMLGRFLPFVGRYAGLGAGLAEIPYARFAVYDALGVLLTVVGFGVAAHLVGRETISQPWFPEALAVAFIGGTVVTLLFLLWRYLAARREQA